MPSFLAPVGSTAVWIEKGGEGYVFVFLHHDAMHHGLL